MIRATIAALILALVFSTLPPGAADAASLGSNWAPNRITMQTFQSAGCDVVAGDVCRVSVTVTARGDIVPATIDVSGDDEIEVTANPDAVDLADGDSTTVELQIQIAPGTPLAAGDSLAARVRLVGASSVSGSLPISIRLPSPRIKWQKGGTDIRVPAGQPFERTVTLTSTTDLAPFRIRSSRNNFLAAEVDGALRAGQPVQVRISGTAPATSRQRKSTISLVPFSDRRAIPSPLSLRVIIEPLIFTWDPPMLDVEVPYQGEASIITTRVSTNYNATGVELRTRDVGLVPLMTTGPRDFTAGVAKEVRFRVNGVYAPSRYHVTIVPYKGSQLLGDPLRVIVNILETRV